MPRGGRVHLLLQHSLVDRADRVLGTPEHAGAGFLGQSEREFGYRTADSPLDALGSERRLVLALAFAPFLRAVCIADCHSDDRDRGVDASEGRDTGNAAPGSDDDAPADLLAKDSVRRADVALLLRGDRRRLQAEAVLADGRRGVVHDLVLRLSALLQREVEARELELDADDVRRQHAKRLLEELLSGLVSLQNDDRLAVHRRGFYAAGTGVKKPPK
jgi:hypothetical protein